MGSSLPPLALAYHGLADVPLARDESRLFSRPSDLRRQVRALRRWGYTLVSFGDLARLAADGRAAGHAALTFDDGLADNLHTLVPVLRELEAPASVFVVSGWLGQQHPDSSSPARLLTADELVELAAAGIEIGAHTASHSDLVNLSDREALRELKESKEQLESILGKPVDLVAYPYGSANEATVAACRAAGYRAACLTESNGSWDDPYRLPREAMGNRDTVPGLWLKRHGRHETLMSPVRPLLRTTVGGIGVAIARKLRS